MADIAKKVPVPLPRRAVRRKEVNVGQTEKWASLATGGALTLLGLRRGSLSGAALTAAGALLLHRGVTRHCLVYDAAGVETAHKKDSPVTPAPPASVAAGHGVKVEKSITINAPRKKVFKFWRRLENLPRFMRHLESVETDGDLSHWVARGPLGFKADWDAEIFHERKYELIAWRSLEGSRVDNAGSVHFRPTPDERGTEVTVQLKYDPPGGKTSILLAKLFGRSPEKEIEEDLERFKQIMETGRTPEEED